MLRKVLRKSFVFSDEDTARLERLRVFIRARTATAVVMLALAVLWDLAVALLKGHQIVFEDKSGVRKDYHPLIDPKGFETTQ